MFARKSKQDYLLAFLSLLCENQLIINKFMEITYDAQADALNIILRKGKAAKTVELAPEIILDLDKLGRPLCLEIIGAREKIGKKQVTEFTMRSLAPAV